MSALPAPRRQPTRPRPLPDRRRRHLRVVESAPRRHPVLFMLLYLALGICIVLGAVSLNALAAGDAVVARDLDARVAAAERHHDQLVADVAALGNPARIAAIAEQKGMVPATDPRFLEPERDIPSDAPAADPPGDDPLKPLLSAGR